MKLNCIVLDSNVFAKTFLQEGDTDVVKALLRFIGQNDIKVLCPDVFLYEVLSIAAQNGFPLSHAVRLLRSFEKANLYMAPLTDRQLQLAMKMAEDGNSKSGFPSIYDSAYHALALSCQGVFFTADKRHISKAKGYGSVVFLDDWEAALSPKSS